MTSNLSNAQDPDSIDNGERWTLLRLAKIKDNRNEVETYVAKAGIVL